MKLGLISDVHCNAEMLGRVLECLDDCDEILCAGDLLYQFRFSNEVLTLIRDRGVLAIPGNHDKSILYTRGHPLQTSPSVDRHLFQYLAGLPSSRQLTFGQTRVALFHGAPWDETDGAMAYYIYPQDESSLQRLAELPADVVVLGHTHVPFQTRVGRMLVVNPGSCGETSDAAHTISYAKLDISSQEVEFFQLPLQTRATK